MPTDNPTRPRGVRHERSIQVTNHGPLITSTNYWDSELAAASKLYCSVNAGAIRVLLPPSAYGALADMRAAKECVLSRGPWPDAPRPAGDRSRLSETPEGIEILWDDGSDSPFALHLTAASFDLLPAEPAPGREWVCSTWVAKDGRPHRALDRICHWRHVPKLPWLKPWTP